ncbi:MAG: hypothetical protein KME08_04305 [Aphanothece sp. CMT-3BRIN-NPC111]|jgi:hypothetical protein|nr:hypothetical protein [Aphanothece sp. CMT-3BRIN-NPC111]
MEALRIIKTFGKLLADNPSVFAEAWQDLPQLNQALAKLPNNQPRPVAQTIVDWCKNYPQIQKALRTVRYQLGDEEENIEPSAPKWDEMMINNISLVRQRIQDAQLQPPPPNNSDADNQNE